jgi:hypothetical protein
MITTTIHIEIIALGPWRTRRKWSTEANQSNKWTPMEMNILWNFSHLGWFEKLKQIIKWQSNNKKGNQNNSRASNVFFFAFSI